MGTRTLAGIITCFLIVGIALGGGSREISESTFNAGGHPAAGVVPTSSGFRITLDALGDSVAGTLMSSASFRVAGGLPSVFQAPGAVKNLRIAADSNGTLAWDAEPSAGQYAVYRGNLDAFAAPAGPEPYGACLTAPVAGTSAIDGTVPPGGEGFFYLVTVANRLGEEGTKGVESTTEPITRPFTCSDSCFCDPVTCAGGCNN